MKTETDNARIEKIIQDIALDNSIYVASEEFQKVNILLLMRKAIKEYIKQL